MIEYVIVYLASVEDDRSSADDGRTNTCRGARYEYEM